MTHPPGCGDLHCLLTRLRMTLRAEVPTKLNQRAVPVLRDHEGIPDSRDNDEGGLGMPLTAAMWRYLGHSEQWGLSRLGMSSIIEASEWCASRHPTHRRPLFTRTLCGQLVYEAAYLGQELTDLLWLHPELELDQLAGMLRAALAHAESWRAERFAQWSKVAGEDAPLPERRPYRPAA